ncbi:hypothetical protein [uncultured Kordia sp.]|uniref:hypothetical protein n=1 Tax=uncultured Kordia sp. TaxID=507699 RepID=UPI00261AF17A|nr:hypothetical protein [uncultured Kordia sp.]
MSYVNIKALVDVVAVLSNDQLEGNVYILDTNKLKGSSKEGTIYLETAVEKNDIILWSTYGLEVESYVKICDIQVNETYLSKPTEEYYQGTNIQYWTSTVKKVPTQNIPYSIHFEVGNTTTLFATKSNGPSVKSVTNS